MALVMIFFSAGVSSRVPRPLGDAAPSGAAKFGDDVAGGGDSGEIPQAPSAKPTANAIAKPRVICRLGNRGPGLSIGCIIIFSM